MSSAARQGVAPAYLLLCLVLGGSAQGIWSNALLQLIGLAIIAWSVAAPAQQPLPRAARQLAWLFIAGLAVVALQLVPLPASLGPHLGGREAFAQGYRLLELDVPARPLSLAPYEGLATLLTVIPAVAIFCAIVRLSAYRASWLLLALLGAALGGILLGALQLSSPDPQTSSWYLYPQNSFGLTGFFANTNNLAMLLVVCLPFLAALVVSARGSSAHRYSTLLALTAVVALILIAAIALNGSLAGYGLLVPALIASALLLMRARSRFRGIAAILAGLGLVTVVAALVTSEVGERALGAPSSMEPRAEIMSTTARAAQDFMPFGSGLGTFRGVYQLYEDPDQVGRIRINHAHNDYLELALELGVPGILLILAFLGWFAVNIWRVWRFADAGPYARAASIAAAVLLAHSLVEFPLRTAALSGVFAMCLALLVARRPPPRADDSELRPARHIVLR